ncbi:SprT-like domain-containing protein [Candidatus Woesearchaeota archaeon]|nr:SprT-like domain-containing protein [Candidatus Woesearchaeota archaeon]MBW3017547.1 SprT-like domain-containing protein [Candidatus Woesearchaeota archaeon]
MGFAEEAFREIFPEKEVPVIILDYSGRFSPYNANVKLANNRLFFSLSKEWKAVDTSIRKGLIQNLLLKLYGRKGEKVSKTIYVDLYDSFTKNLHHSIPKTKTEHFLEQSFNRVNERFFYGLVEQPNLEWSGYSKTTLGTYNYQTDTIRISRFFAEAPEEMLDYVMYHEVLHKKVKFKNTGLTCQHHTFEFRAKEKDFPGQKQMEKDIGAFLKWKRKPVEQRLIAAKKKKRESKQFSLKRWLFGN